MPCPSSPTERTATNRRRRVVSLILVHVVIALHVAHFELAGQTLAPLQLDEALMAAGEHVLTAGAILGVAVVASVLLFGRFFCGWGCHVLALQDLASRLLRGRASWGRAAGVFVLVPIALLLLLAIGPHLGHLGREPIPMTISRDPVMGSFWTTDLFRNLPGPFVAFLTLFTVSVALTLFLGPRAFCRHVCPFGALFGALDRSASRRVVLTGSCVECGECTRGCDSGIDVMSEVSRFGRVVSPGCIKDLACVSVCPTRGLAIARGPRPRLREGWKVSMLSWRAEALALVVGVFVFLATRNLYDSVPLLLGATLAVLSSSATLELVRRAAESPFRRTSYVFESCFALGVAFVGHAAFIQYHTTLGERSFRECAREVAAGPGANEESVRSAVRHLSIAYEYGIVRTLALERRLASVLLLSQEPWRAEPHLEAVLASEPSDRVARAYLERARRSRR
ncbi:MAG: 4Fe-4S binding protein [Deltaproteobacteria bacterium]|nr:4Fe-4S binding protein [Deltaproteobacteria bacterium]